MPVLARRHERLIGEREHGGVAVGQMLDRRAERAAHAAGELQVDGVPDGQPLERRQRGLVLAAQHDQDIVEAGVQTCRTARRTSGSPPNGRRSFCVPILVDAPAASTTALTMKK